MKIFLRVLHGLAVVATGVGLYALIMIVAMLVCLRLTLESTMANLDEGNMNVGWMLYLANGSWFLMAGLLGLGVFAIIRRASWKIILPVSAATLAGLLYLRWDGDEPPRPDLGPRVTEADRGYQIVMWMSQDSPHSRLAEGGVLDDAEIKTLRLPPETGEWPAHLRAHRGEIMRAWEQDRLGREWIDAINGCPPAGVWTQGMKSPMIKFAPVRLSMFVRTARAYGLALDGKRDEAIESLLPMISAWHHFQRMGPALMNQMIAQVMLKQCYRVAGEVLRMGEVGREIKMKFAIVLRQAPVEAVFRNALLGEYDWLADSVDKGLAAAGQKQQAQVEQHWTHWIAPNVVSSANQTKRELLRTLERPCELAVRRDMTGLEKLGKKPMPKWYLKNPVGMMLVNMATLAYTKVVAQIWEIDDLRLDLLKQLEKP